MNQPVSTIMHCPVIPVSMEDTIEAVETMMKAKRISSAPVYDADGAILGVITSTDLVKLHATGRDPKSVRAWEICTYRPIEVTPDTTLERVAGLMLEHKVHHVMVMENEALKGLVSALDFIKLYLRQQRG